MVTVPGGDPDWDRTTPTVIGCLDRAMRAFGGVPTYWLTDNERTVTMDHVAGVPVRHPQMVAFGGHYGATVATCVPRDPESKGGSESTVKLAKADLVPTEANLLDAYESWGGLVDACDTFMTMINSREHRATRQAPAGRLAEEQQRLHPLPEHPYTATFGETRKVSWSATFSYGGVTYSAPHTLVDETVWVRVDGDEIVATHCPVSGAVEVARHRRSTPGNPVIDDAHYPPRPPGPLGRQPKATNPAEVEFLALGEGARLWLVEAASAGTSRVKVKMPKPLISAGSTGSSGSIGRSGMPPRSAGSPTVTWPPILAAQPAGEHHAAGEDHSLQPGTGAWEGFGR